MLLSHLFRKHVVTSRRPFVVMDGKRDRSLANNPAVRDGTVRSCVGLPLRTGSGQTVGTLLAMDRQPRGWTSPQLHLLETLSALIVSEMELGWRNAGRREPTRAQRASRRSSEHHDEPPAAEALSRRLGLV
jgi:GAF domain-containing protein